MLETITALIFAHVLADYVFRTARMEATQHRLLTLMLHGLVVLITAHLALGQITVWEPLLLAIIHVFVDAIKAHALPKTLWAHFLDQSAHIATIVIVALLAPDLFAEGVWTDFKQLPALMIIVTGAIAATKSGSHAIRILVAGWDMSDVPGSLPNGGELIGLLERGIIFLLIIVGQPAGIGFLIAAKSVLRFDSSKTQRASEYVIIGTLASFGWAMIVGWATLAMLSFLPPLGIPVLKP